MNNLFNIKNNKTAYRRMAGVGAILAIGSALSVYVTHQLKAVKETKIDVLNLDPETEKVLGRQWVQVLIKEGWSPQNAVGSLYSEQVFKLHSKFLKQNKYPYVTATGIKVVSHDAQKTNFLIQIEFREKDLKEKNSLEFSLIDTGKSIKAKNFEIVHYTGEPHQSSVDKRIPVSELDTNSLKFKLAKYLAHKINTEFEPGLPIPSEVLLSKPAPIASP